MAKRSFDSIDALKAFVGQPAVSGDAIAIDQAMIDAFAAVTHDQQWIHVDMERCRRRMAARRRS